MDEYLSYNRSHVEEDTAHLKFKGFDIKVICDNRMFNSEMKKRRAHLNLLL